MLEFATADYPTAKRPHRCFGCRGTINPGERYRRQTVFYNGTAYTQKLCPKCVYVEGWIPDGEIYHEDDLAWDHNKLPDNYMDQFNALAAARDVQWAEYKAKRKARADLILQMRICKTTLIELARQLRDYGRHDKAAEAAGAADMLDEWIANVEMPAAARGEE